MAKTTEKRARSRSLWPLAVAYPLFAHAAILSENRLWTLAAVVILAVLVLGPALLRGSKLAWITLVIAGLGAARLLHSGAIELALYAPPVLIMAFMAWAFGHTLRPGETPLIERIVRALHDPAEILEPAIFSYARNLTWLWTILLATLATVNLGLALCASPNGLLLAAGITPPVVVPQRIWSLFANVLNYVVIAGFFGLEYAWRRRRFPQQEYRSIADFTRRLVRLGPSLRTMSNSAKRPSARSVPSSQADS
jgi:uncharacterized membrane protein